MDNGTDTNELYKSISPAVCEELSRLEEQATVPIGTTLISHTVMPEHVVIIQQGSVQISVAAGEKVLSLSIAGNGKVLGLRPIVANVLPEVDVVTLEECTIRRIAKQSFLEVLKQRPEIYFAISKVLSTDLNTAERLLRELPRSPAKEKNRVLA